MLKQVLINIGEIDSRVAILEDGQLVELFVEQRDQANIVGNIYKGRVEGVVPGLQAAFVDIGHEKNAFLHFSDVLTESLPNAESEEEEEEPAEPVRKGRNGRKENPRRGFHHQALVGGLLEVGQDILVQVIKEPISVKGPRVSSFLSLPGRYLVMLPYETQSGGVSKKIEDRRERNRLRRILDKIKKKSGAHIIRTAGIGKSEEEIMADINFLEKQWRALDRLQAKTQAPALIHNDQDILYRLTRDIFNEEIDEIWVDGTAERNALKKHVKQMVPELSDRILPYKDRLVPLFDKFDVERQVRRALRRKVWLKSGGYLIFDEMEALTAIDVNSGKYTGKGDQAKMILRTNIEAVHMVARQLRLRDIGGLIVVDLIDMNKEENRRSVKGEFLSLLRKDRARTAITSISEFGLVEMTRQRARRSLRKQLFHDCPHCQGEGMIINDSENWRLLKREILSCLVEAPRPNLEVRCHPGLIDYIDEAEARESLAKIEKLYRIEIKLIPTTSLDIEEFTIKEIPKPGAKLRTAAEKKEDEKAARTRTSKKQPGRESGKSETEPRERAPEKEAAEPSEHSRKRKQRRKRHRDEERVPVEAQPEELVESLEDEALVLEDLSELEVDATPGDNGSEESPTRKKRRRRRRKKKKNTEVVLEGAGDEIESKDVSEDLEEAKPLYVPHTHPDLRQRQARGPIETFPASEAEETVREEGEALSETEEHEASDSASPSGGESPARPSRSSRRRRRRRKKAAAAENAGATVTEEGDHSIEAPQASGDSPEDTRPEPSRSEPSGEATREPEAPQAPEARTAEERPRSSRSSRRRRYRRTTSASPSNASPAPSESDGAETGAPAGKESRRERREPARSESAPPTESSTKPQPETTVSESKTVPQAVAPAESPVVTKAAKKKTTKKKSAREKKSSTKTSDVGKSATEQPEGPHTVRETGDAPQAPPEKKTSEETAKKSSKKTTKKTASKKKAAAKAAPEKKGAATKSAPKKKAASKSKAQKKSATPKKTSAEKKRARSAPKE